LATSASKAVAKSKIATGKEDEERLARRRHDIRIIQPTYAAAKKAQETLEKTPADPEANLAVGRWRCFYKGDWSAGLTLLAKGSDEKLKALAEQEIKAPADADEQVQIADAWWDLAQKEAGTARDSLHLHAGEIYTVAMPNITSALRKAAIEKRLAEIARVQRPTSSAAADSAAGPIELPIGRWVDLLKQTNPAKDAERGNWSRRGTEVFCEPEGIAVLKLPAVIDGGYDLEVDFTRGDGDQDVDCLIPVGSHHCAVILSGYEGKGGISAVEIIDGRYSDSDENPTVKRPGKLENGHRYRLVVSVRLLAAEQATVDVTLDGKRYLPSWTGGQASLGARDEWTLRDPRHVGLGVLHSRVTFHSVRLRMVSGHASGDASLAESAAPQFAPATSASDKSIGPVKFPLGHWVDVLRLVDTTKNLVEGKWSRSGTQIVVEQGDGPRIAFPVAVEGSYDLEVVFSRLQGTGEVRIQIPVGSHACDVEWGKGGNVGGLDALDGHHSDDENNPTKVVLRDIVNGHAYCLLVKIRMLGANQASIDTSIDGKPFLPHWEGHDSVLTVDGWWRMPTLDHLGVAAYQSQVAFSSARLRMISGHASVDDALSRTTFIGGISGDPFEDLPNPRSLLVGFNCTVVPRPGGTPVVKSVQPIYFAGGRTVASKVYGHEEGDTIAIEAKKGYAVAGIVAKGGDFVDGFKVIFMRIGKQSLDTTTSYESDWVGGQGGNPEKVLGGDGEPVIGIYGISGSDLNRLGLIQAN
jgi:hypothetical protein